MELHSLMNYQNVTQNLFCATHFFWRFLVKPFPQTSDLAFRSKPEHDRHPDPAVEIPPPFTPHTHGPLGIGTLE
jgi:hypothetical protein